VRRGHAAEKKLEAKQCALKRKNKKEGKSGLTNKKKKKGRGKLLMICTLNNLGAYNTAGGLE